MINTDNLFIVNVLKSINIVKYIVVCIFVTFLPHY